MATPKDIIIYFHIASRRQGGAEMTHGMLARWKHEISVAIMRRRAAMARSTLPKPTTRERWMLSGVAECTDDGFGYRLPPIAEEEPQESDPPDLGYYNQ